MLIITTKDGSHTLFSEQFNEVYHSRNGAIQESLHVFIKNGLNYFEQPEIKILEIGLGTGLNALLTMLEAEKRNLKVDYTAIELYPLPIETIKALNYTEQLGYEYCYGPYHSLHLVRWNEKHSVTNNFSFTKIRNSLFDSEIRVPRSEIVFYDAFAPEHQPEMWTVDAMKKMYDQLETEGILVTYCSKSSVQRAMKEAGFTIEKLPGPAGRREMLRAHKK